MPLTELPVDHPANDYLASRGFDPRVLGAMYELSYCEKAEGKIQLASNRIIIPTRMRGKLAGWQARFIGERDWKTCPVPKYADMPGMKKRMMLYNFDVAIQQPFLVVVEGVFDAWAVGPEAVALLGKNISFAQKRTIQQDFADRPIVLMLDGDAQDDIQGIYEELKTTMKKGVVRVSLPTDQDPGDLTRDATLKLIIAAAEEQGVDLGLTVEDVC